MINLLFDLWILGLVVSSIGFVATLILKLVKKSYSKWLYSTTAVSWLSVALFALLSLQENRAGAYIPVPEMIMTFYSPVWVVSSYLAALEWRKQSTT